MKNIVIVLLAMAGSLNFLYAQSAGKITGSLLDAEGKPISYANVILFTVADTNMVKAEITDDKGLFELGGIPAGDYWIKASFVGLPDFKSESLVVEAGKTLALPAFRLQPATNDLAEVVVKAQKPLIEVKPDKMVFNVDGSINAQGNTALELLRKSPGVMVDNNDNIMLQGRSGVRVYIDGKPSPLSSSDLASYLSTLQSSEIESIEIITNPSSKYDAQGNGGIINIKFKKDKNLGANGSFDAGYSIGKLPRYNAKLSGNYRNKKVNLFGSYGYGEGKNENIFNLYREQSGLSFDQRNINLSNWNNHNFRVGADLFLNKKSTIGFMTNGNISDYHGNSNSRTPIAVIGSGIVDSMLLASNIHNGMRSNYNFNLNYAFDGGNGTTWNVDADYGLFKNDGDEYQPNRYTDPTGTEIFEERIYANETPTTINISTFKIDHERNLFGGKLGVGIKLSQVNTDNTFNFFNVINGDKDLDETRSNQFDYKENVNAAYANYSGKISEKMSYQLGLRAEQTNSEGDLTAYMASEEDNVKRSYLDFFPSGGLTYQANQMNSLQLTYSRRIDRPSYQDLNPFQNRLDELTFEKGNPFLNPQYSHNFQLTHTYKYRFNTSLSYSRTTDLITRITDTSGVSASFITWLNLAQQDVYSLSFSAPIQITKWWNSYVSLTGSRTENTADYGDGKIVDLQATSFNGYAQQAFSLPKDLKLEISGWYNSPGIWGGTFKMKAMGNVDIGLQKKILEGRANLKVSVSDVFRTNRWSGISQFGSLYMKAGGNWDSRRLNVNFSYRFGNDEVKAARRRRTGLEDEQRRIKSE
ncbi:MAG: TonB-dependent receptor [Lewinella sp.]|nr:TonB-dependent receptor [Lewinella sp.]